MKTIDEDLSADLNVEEEGDNNEGSSSSVDIKSSARSARPAMPSMGSKQLSEVSSKYDVGSKGFLTPAEQKMREMDEHGHGQLSNEQVSKIVEQTLSLRHVNRRLRFWVTALFVAVIILGLTNLGTAFAAAILAKDTSVNTDSGVMTVKKDSSITVATIAAGDSLQLQLQTDETTGKKFFCLNTRLAGLLMNSTIEGRKHNLIVTDGTTTFTYGVAAGGSGFNRDEACFGTTQSGVRLCTNHTDGRCSTGRRRLSPSEKSARFREHAREGHRRLSCQYSTLAEALPNCDSAGAFCLGCCYCVNSGGSGEGEGSPFNAGE